MQMNRHGQDGCQMSRLVLAVLASGQGSNLQAILNAIAEGSLLANVAVVISDKEHAKALSRAREAGIPAIFIHPGAYTTRDGYDAALVEALNRYPIMLGVMAGYMRLVTPLFVEAYRDRLINIHPSLLPAFPGLHPQRQALQHGVKVSGCTVHFVDEEVDHGPIIAQRAVPVIEGDTEETLTRRILEQEHRLLPEVLQCFAAGRVGLVTAGGSRRSVFISES